MRPTASSLEKKKKVYLRPAWNTSLSLHNAEMMVNAESGGGRFGGINGDLHGRCCQKSLFPPNAVTFVASREQFRVHLQFEFLVNGAW